MVCYLVALYQIIKWLGRTNQEGLEGQIARMGEIMNVFKIFVEEPEEENHLRHLGVFVMVYLTAPS
jgi:hypothetical protein